MIYENPHYRYLSGNGDSDHVEYNRQHQDGYITAGMLQESILYRLYLPVKEPHRP
jgi:hypothetical protein